MITFVTAFVMLPVKTKPCRARNTRPAFLCRLLGDELKRLDSFYLSYKESNTTSNNDSFSGPFLLAMLTVA